jgi:hypothetical protein
MQEIQLLNKPTTAVIKPALTPRKRKSKPYSCADEPYNTVRGESSLWVAVITQAMMDALSRAGSSEALYHKHEAINWLTGNSRDFVLVCLFAGYDPDYIRRRAKRALLTPVSWRAEAGKGQRYHELKAYRKRLKEKALGECEGKPAGDSIIIVGPWSIPQQKNNA